MDGSTLFAVQGPVGLGHFISRHIHRRVHSIRGRLFAQRAAAATDGQNNRMKITETILLVSSKLRYLDN